MPNNDVGEYEKALSAWERMLAFEMDNLQRSNILRRIADSCLCIIKSRTDEKACRRAIEAYEEALHSYDADRYPAIHARILRGLGYAYSSLSDLAVRQSNLHRAISCWEGALCFFSSQEYPRDHACLQNELGGAYRKLAELESRRENGKKAVEACMAALRLYDRREMPLDFAAAKANLAGAYLILAQAAGYPADEAEGCKKAILTYQEAISVYSKDKYPQEYGAMISNLAIAYLTLAQVEEKEENCQRALHACRVAENYLSREEQPLAYAALENNLGNAYIALAEEVEA
ncbi:MAG: hypothetical protein MUE87_05235, partial [Methanothrix sp.]|nr:hypothetical protein [Methanothrix sp.]